MIKITIETNISAASLEIARLGQLEKGWHFGEGDPIGVRIRERALQVAKFGEELGLRVAAFPCVEGEIVLAFYYRSLTLEVYVNHDNTFDLTLESGYGFNFDVLYEAEGVDLQTLKNRLIENDFYNRAQRALEEEITYIEQDSRERGLKFGKIDQMTVRIVEDR